MGQAKLLGVCYGATIAALVATRPRYQVLQAPEEDEHDLRLSPPTPTPLPLDYKTGRE